MDRYAIVIPSIGKAIKLHCDDGDGISLKDLQKLVEGYIETVSTALAPNWAKEPVDSIILIVNAEGKLKGLPFNFDATDVSNLLYDTICGNAVMMATRGAEFVGFQEAAADNIIERWDL